MEITLQHSTRFSYGASSLLLPLSHRLASGLNSEGYGVAISKIEVTISFPATIGELTTQEANDFGTLPRKRFLRKRGTLKIDWLSTTCTAHEQNLAELKHMNKVVPDVIDALSFVRTALNDEDDFDVDAFDRDLAKVFAQKCESEKELEELDAQDRAASEAESAAEFQRALETVNPTKKFDSFEFWWPQNRSKGSIDWDQFLDESAYIKHWYWVLLREQLKGDGYRLILYLDEQVKEVAHAAMNAIECPFDYAAYFKLPDDQRMAMVAATMRDGLACFASSMRQDPAMVEAAYAHMQENEFRFRGELPKRCSGDRLTARLEFEYGINGMDLEAIFTKKGGRKVIGRKPMGHLPADSWLYQALGAGWRGDQFRVKRKDVLLTVDTNDLV